MNLWDHIGSTVRLRGITRHGKNRVREQGELWDVVGVPHGVVSMSPMPICPALKGQMRGDFRWFSPKDFEVVEVIPG
jgi:hypothetical protein